MTDVRYYFLCVDIVFGETHGSLVEKYLGDRNCYVWLLSKEDEKM